MFIQVFSLIVLTITLVSILGVIVALTFWPGRTARVRKHPYVDAVQVAEWVGMISAWRAVDIRRPGGCGSPASGRHRNGHDL